MLVLLVQSCREELISGTDTVSDDAVLRLSINTPQPTALRNFRTTGDVENNISEVRVLVFGESGGEFRFKYMVEGTNVVSDGNTRATFTALVKTSQENIKLMLVANADRAFDSYQPIFGENETTVKSKVKISFDPQFSANLPMWGEVALPSGISATGTNDLSTTMLRAMARIDVVKNLEQDSYPFDFNSIHIFRTNNVIQVIPNKVIDGRLQVDTPSVPVESDFNPYGTEIVSIDKEVDGDGIEGIRRLYIPEAISNAVNKLEGVTSVVVGGYFNKDTYLTYYRVDFNSKLIDHPYGQVLRNHKYIFNIRRVWGRGWSTPEDAAKNNSTNVEVVIENWNDFVTDMNFDAEHYLGVSSRKLLLEAEINSTKEIIVTTDLESYTLEWADENGIGQGGAILPGGTLGNGVFSVESSADLKSIMVTVLQSNVGGESIRKSYILVKANRFEILVTLEQDKFTEAARPIRLLSVRSYLGYFGSTDPGGLYGAEARATGMRGILTNTANYGPDGVVKTMGYFLSDVTEVNANSYLTDIYLSRFDVVYLPDIAATTVISVATATRINNWLRGNKKRFLVVSIDEYNRNKNMLDVLGVTGLVWGGLTGHYPLTKKSPNISYFTDSGPFTVAQSAVIPQNFIYRNYDGAHGEISIASNPNITPILTGPSGGIVLGVDLDKRVLYVGDVDMFNYNPGAGATTDNRITNTTGTINNNASLLMANIWAWIAQVVLSK